MDEIAQLKDRIKELEKRQKNAIEQLHSLANEQVHRLHGCPYPEVDIEDLEEVISILNGEDER
jgi:hypothetical protein